MFAPFDSGRLTNLRRNRLSSSVDFKYFQSSDIQGRQVDFGIDRGRLDGIEYPSAAKLILCAEPVAMSAILSADDLNDFISPGVACIKPVETLPAKKEQEEVSTQMH